MRVDGCFNATYCVEVAGEFACFTRPEMKVERVSYDVITPSAARGIFEAILWKPAIRWKIRKIEVLNDIRWATIRRNELKSVMSSPNGVFIEDDRTQRSSLLLRDVRYRLHAELEFVAPGNRPASALVKPPGEDEKPRKYHEMFRRRARKGQCAHMPYLGCREFACSVLRLVERPEEADARPIGESGDLGFMLLDLDYGAAGHPRPMFFRAVMRSGVIDVPDASSAEVLR